uniref:Uncharacterized protein n=1 Tax=Cereibacter sphaeroides (strain ATCC 17025 / ATH 2.4.3) TaxID=349102 RepID=A4WY80_CERS5
MRLPVADALGRCQRPGHLRVRSRVRCPRHLRPPFPCHLQQDEAMAPPEPEIPGGRTADRARVRAVQPAGRDFCVCFRGGGGTALAFGTARCGRVVVRQDAMRSDRAAVVVPRRSSGRMAGSSRASATHPHGIQSRHENVRLPHSYRTGAPIVHENYRNDPDHPVGRAADEGRSALRRRHHRMGCLITHGRSCKLAAN